MQRHPPGTSGRTGLARVLSKLGYCSRSEAQALVAAGRVTVNQRPVLDPEQPAALGLDRIAVDGREVQAAAHVYLALNKPRGLVTTHSDEHGRRTVFECLAGHDLPHVSPVGRLDQASEGLLLFTNDTTWAHRITDPEGGLDKTYHVQIAALADDALCRRLIGGTTDHGDFLKVRGARILRLGEKNCWLEIVLDEGRNRHIRRLLGAFGIEVLRLVRVAIGGLELGTLAKGACRQLTDAEVAGLGGRQRAASPAPRATRPD